VPGVQELGLEQSEVDIGRALSLARLAREAVAQSQLQLGRTQACGEPSFQGGTDGVGTPPGGHDLLAGGDEGRTHGRAGLATPPAAVALLEVAHERPVLLDESDHRLERELERVAVTEAEVGVDAIPSRVDDLARVEQALGIEELLDAPRRLYQPRPEVIGQVLGARDTDAVLGGQRAAEP